MPIRVFACMNEHCSEMGKQIDTLKSLSDDSPEMCPVCEDDLSPVMPSSVGIAFKGSGFYCTDYR